MQSNITVAFSSPSHSPYSNLQTGLSFSLPSHFCFTLSLQQCIHRSLFPAAISFLIHTFLTAMYTRISLSCCHLISASHSPSSSVYTGLSFLSPSHFCFTLSLQQCIHSSLFPVAISFLLHTLLTAVYTQVSLSCCHLIAASHFPYSNVHTDLSFLLPSHFCFTLPYSSVYTGLSFLLPSHCCFTLSLQQCIHRSLFPVAISFLLHTSLQQCIHRSLFPVADSFLLHTLLTAMYTQVSLSRYGLLSISKTLLLLFFNSR